MDTLTHTVLGACLGEAIAGKQLRKKAMLAGALVNNLPDVDVAVQPFCEPAQGLLVHRGITHSILFNVIMAAVLTWFFYRLFKKQGVSLKQCLLLVGSGLCLHILLDALTSYGTGWFEPFNHARVSFNLLFILDPFFMLPLLVSALALLILKGSSPARPVWAKTALGLSLAYLAITFCIKQSVSHTVQKDLALRSIPYTDYMTTPAPLNNLLWYVAVKNDNVSYVGYYSIFDRIKAVDYEIVPKNDSLLAPHRSSAEVQRLLQFSKGYYQVSREDSLLVFSDLRFGNAGGWLHKNTPFVFRFNVAGHTGVTHLQQARFKSFEEGAMSGLVKRIKGN